MPKVTRGPWGPRSGSRGPCGLVGQAWPVQKVVVVCGRVEMPVGCGWTTSPKLRKAQPMQARVLKSKDYNEPHLYVYI